jgi:hypothetical protein
MAQIGSDIRAAPRGGAAFKYDLLTALGCHACRGDKHRQRRALRLMTLITARYDWRHDRLATGQREIAALWGVDARTVKREMAWLREAGWLVLKVPSARGRVACYGLGVAAILADTRADWQAVGPDFAERMAGPAPDKGGADVIPFPDQATVEPAGDWGRLSARMRDADRAAHAAWIAPLRAESCGSGRITLRAPSAFHASFVRSHHLGTLRQLATPLGIEVVEVAG